MFIDWTVFLGIGNLVLVLLGIFGGYVVLRSAKSKAAQEIEQRVREAQQAEIEVLQARVVRLEKDAVTALGRENHLSDMLNLIIDTLAKRGIEVSIDNDIVLVKDSASNSTVTVRATRKPAPKTYQVKEEE